jgi:hypothetical protein
MRKANYYRVQSKILALDADCSNWPLDEYEIERACPDQLRLCSENASSRAAQAAA